MQNTHLIKVVGVSEERLDKNEQIYKLVEFSNPTEMPVVDENTGEFEIVRVNAKRCSINRYKESYLNGKQEFLFDAKVGEKTPGMVVTHPVEPYTIEDKIVDSYSTVVFGDTNSVMWKAWVIQAFKNAGHPIKGYLTPEEVTHRYLEDILRDDEERSKETPVKQSPEMALPKPAVVPEVKNTPIEPAPVVEEEGEVASVVVQYEFAQEEAQEEQKPSGHAINMSFDTTVEETEEDSAPAFVIADAPDMSQELKF